MLKYQFLNLITINNLKSKIIAIILSVSVFTTLIGLLLLYSFDIPNRIEELKNSANLTSTILAENCALPLYSFDKDQLNRILKSSTDKSFIIMASIVAESKDTMASYKKPNFHKLKDEDVISLSKDIKLNDELLGKLYLIFSNESIKLRSKDYIITTSIILSLTIIISLILGLKLQSLISDPIIKLSKIAKKISSSNDYNIKIINETNDETGVLYNEFNKMIIKIKEREDELYKARKFLTDVLNSIPSALVTVKPDLKIISVNHAATKLSSVEKDSLNGCPLNIAFPLFQDQFTKISNNHNQKESVVLRKVEKNINGQKCYFNVGFYPLTDSDGLVVRMDEVTKQVTFESLMMQSEKIMSIGSLGAGMAHEINNPLGVMIQTAQNIERRISPDLEVNQKIAKEVGISLENLSSYMHKREIPDFLIDIKKNGSKAAQIVDNMLKFSRKSDSTKKSSNITEIINNSIKLVYNDFNLKKRYNLKNLEILKEYAVNIPPIEVCENELEQVFINILKNSIQVIANEDNPGKIIIRVVNEESSIRIEFEDNGPGMDKTTKKHLFEPFYTTKPVGEGTGLGLSVSYMIIVKNHNGVLDVVSTVGRGSNFIIKLPHKGQ